MSDGGHSAMSDVPRDEPPEDARPWERPGAVRRDCEPHRAELLWHLAVAACAITPAAPVAAILGAWVWLGARQDLRRMAAGRMDPAGWERTRQARMDGLAALVIGTGLTAPGAALALVQSLDIR